MGNNKKFINCIATTALVANALIPGISAQAEELENINELDLDPSTDGDSTQENLDNRDENGLTSEGEPNLEEPTVDEPNSDEPSGDELPPVDLVSDEPTPEPIVDEQNASNEETLPEGLEDSNTDYLFNYDTGIISDYIGPKGADVIVTIPSTINGVPVVGIGDSVFAGDELKEVIIHDGIKTIGNSAFQRSTIKSIVLPDSVEVLGNQAFYSSELEEITLSKSLKEIGNFTFSQTKLKGVYIPENIEKIGAEAFSRIGEFELTGMQGLKEIGNRAFYKTIIGEFIAPNSLVKIDTGAFLSSEINNLELNEGLEVIGNSAFWGLLDTDLNIPNSVVEIGPSAFKLSSLTNVSFGQALKTIGNSAFEGASLKELNLSPEIESIGELAFKGNSISTINFNNSLKFIGSYAFADNSLTELTTPESLSKVGDYAFVNNKLEEVILNDNLKEIGEFAFSGKIPENGFNEYKYPEAGGERGNVIKNITLPKNIEKMGVSAFEWNEIEELEIPGSLKTIPYYSFANNKLKELSIGEGVEIIEGYAFQALKRKEFGRGIKEINFPSTLTKIGEQSFKHSIEAEDLVLPAKLKEISANAFEANSIKNLVLNEQLEFIGNSAFYNSGVQSVITPEESLLRIIGAYAFYGGTFEEFDFSSMPKLSFIGTYAFDNVNLKEVDLSNSLIEEISYGTFSNNKIETLKLPKNLTKIGYEAFENNEINEIDLPESLEIIEYSAFGDNNIKELDLKNVKKIEPYSFMLNEIENLTLPKGLTEIPNYAFSNNNIKSLNFHEDSEVYYIGEFAFYKNKIEEMNLPETVSYIGESAFEENALKEFIAPESLTTIENNSFKNQSTKMEKVVLKNVETIGAYSFSHNSIKELDLGKLTYIPNRAFYSNSLESLIIPEGVEEIADSAFSDNKLKEVDFSVNTTLTTIGRSAFNVNELKELSVPKNVTFIGSGAFANNKLEGIALFSEELSVEEEAFYGNEDLNKVEIHSKNASIRAGYLEHRPGLTLTAYPTSQVKLYADSALGSNYTFIPLDSSVADEASYEFDAETQTITAYNSNLPNVVIPETIGGVTVKHIGPNVFENKGLVSVTFNPSLETIGDSAFLNNRIYNLYMTDNIKHIGDYSFYRAGVESVRFSPNLEKIGKYALAGKGVTTPEGISETPNGKSNVLNLQLKIKSSLKEIDDYAFAGISVSSLEFEEGIERIGKGAFNTSAKFSKLVLPDSLTELGESAFYENPFSEITIGKGLKVIPDYAFTNNRLNRLNISPQVEHIGKYAFSTHKVEFYREMYLNLGQNPSMKTIGEKAFYNLSITGKLNFGENLKEIGSSAFEIYDGKYAKGNISEFYLPEGIEKIGAYALRNNKIDSISIPSSLKSIGNGAFRLNNIKGNIDLSNVEEIGAYSFAQNRISTVTFPEELEYVPAGLFYNNAIENLDLSGAKIKGIGEQAFYNNNLNSLDLSETSVQTVDEEAFYHNFIKEVKLPQTIEFIKEKAFAENEIKSLDVPSSMIDLDGFSDNQIEELILREGLQTLGNFRNNKINSLDIPDSVTEVEDFENNSIKTLKIGSGLNTIEYNTFKNNLIEDLVIPENISSIGEGAFANNPIHSSLILNPDLPIKYYYTSEYNPETDTYETVYDTSFGMKEEREEILTIYSLPGGVLEEDANDSKIHFAKIDEYKNGAYSNYRILTMNSVSYGTLNEENPNEQEIAVEGFSTEPEVTVKVEGFPDRVVKVENYKYKTYYNITPDETTDLEIDVEVTDGTLVRTSKIELYYEKYSMSGEDKKFKSYFDIEMPLNLISHSTVDNNIEVRSVIYNRFYISGGEANYISAVMGTGDLWDTSSILNSFSVAAKEENFEDNFKFFNEKLSPKDTSNYTSKSTKGKDVFLAKQSSSVEFVTPKIPYNEDEYAQLEAFEGNLTIVHYVFDDGKYVGYVKNNITIDKDYGSEPPEEEYPEGNPYFPYIEMDSDDYKVKENTNFEVEVDIQTDVETLMNEEDLTLTYSVYKIEDFENGIYDQPVRMISSPFILEEKQVVKYTENLPKGEYIAYFDIIDKNGDYLQWSESYIEVNDYGSISVSYIDAETGEVIGGKTFDNLENGTHTITAPEIDGYDLNDSSTKDVRISEEEKNKGIFFLYKKKEEEIKPPEKQYGSILVNYVDKDGNVIGSFTKVNLELGTYTENSIEIEGYTLSDSTEKTVELTPENLHGTITFVYEPVKEEIVLTGSLNVEYVDINGLNIAPSIAKSIPLGRHVETMITIEGYELVGQSAVTIDVDKDNLVHTIQFVYQKTFTPEEPKPEEPKPEEPKPEEPKPEEPKPEEPKPEEPKPEEPKPEEPKPEEPKPEEPKPEEPKPEEPKPEEPKPEEPKPEEPKPEEPKPEEPKPEEPKPEEPKPEEPKPEEPKPEEPKPEEPKPEEPKPEEPKPEEPKPEEPKPEEPKPEEPKPEEPKPDKNDLDGYEDENEISPLPPKTGDNSSPVGPKSLLLFALASIAIHFRRKNKEK